MKKLVLLRRTSQAFFLVLFVLILWTTTYPLKGLLPASTFFVFDPLIMIATSLSERVWLSGLVFAASMLALTLLLGRFFCGWVCPLGAVFDAAARLRRPRKSKRPAAPNPCPARDVAPRSISVKYALFALIMGAALLGFQWAWVFDPIVTLARFVSLNLIPAATLLLNRAFIFIIKTFRLYGPFLDFYRELKGSLLGIPVYYFSHSLAILVFFLVIVASVIFVPRFWCRALCPLGAMYAALGRFAPLRRRVEKCNHCLACYSDCRMGAIRRDLTYDQGECILCMDCLYDCVGRHTRFGFKTSPEISPPSDRKGAITRGNFIFLMGLTAAALGFKRPAASSPPAPLIRPPASLPENDFMDRCVRCGNCMKVCITNGLQPVLWGAGGEGIWTPQLVPEIGYCEYNCTLCGQVCPTHAIAQVTVEEKHRARLGRAVIDRALCIPWSLGGSCLVCEEHCPVFQKAIKVIDDKTGILKPAIDKDLCVGCGLCQNKCPVRPTRAIRVFPINH